MTLQISSSMCGTFTEKFVKWPQSVKQSVAIIRRVPYPVPTYRRASEDKPRMEIAGTGTL